MNHKNQVKEMTKEKAKNCLAFEIFWTETSLTFTSENALEVLEWVHNFRKYHLFRAKFGIILWYTQTNR